MTSRKSQERRAARRRAKRELAERARPPRPSLKWQDVIGLLSVPLTVAGMRSDDTLLLVVCFLATFGGVSFSVWNHRELSARRRLEFCGLIALVLLSLGAYLGIQNYRKDLESNIGILVPANDPAPPNNCEVPPGSFAVYLGDMVAHSVHFPFTILRLKGRELLTVDREADGKAIRISILRIFDDRDDIIARVENNRLEVLGGARKTREDRSTLVVYDHADTQVLRLRLLNEHALSVRGIFRSLGAVVRADDTGLWTRGAHIQDFCAGEVRTALQID